MSIGTPAPLVNSCRTRCPGAFGATMKMFTSFGGTIFLKWIEKPWATAKCLPARSPCATSFSYVSGASSSGTSIMTMSPQRAASAVSITERPAPSALAREALPGLRPTATV